MRWEIATICSRRIEPHDAPWVQESNCPCCYYWSQSWHIDQLADADVAELVLLRGVAAAGRSRDAPGGCSLAP